MSGCWQALCFFLGPSFKAGRGEDWHFFSRSRQYRSTSNHLLWESNLTQPLLEDMQGITALAISPFLTYLKHFAELLLSAKVSKPNNSTSLLRLPYSIVLIAIQLLRLHSLLLKYQLCLFPAGKSLLFLCLPDETSLLARGEPSTGYFTEGELESTPSSSLTPVSAEQLFPAGKILQIDERPSIR